MIHFLDFMDMLTTLFVYGFTIWFFCGLIIAILKGPSKKERMARLMAQQAYENAKRRQELRKLAYNLKHNRLAVPICLLIKRKFRR